MPGKNPLEESKSVTAIRAKKRNVSSRSLANLKPYLKGISGNIKGRPTKYVALKKQLDKLGDEEVTDFMGKKSGKRRDIVLKRIWKGAINGDMKFIQLLAGLGCLDGKQ